MIREHERLMAQRSHWTDMVKRLHDHVLKVTKSNTEIIVNPKVEYFNQETKLNYNTTCLCVFIGIGA